MISADPSHPNYALRYVTLEDHEQQRRRLHAQIRLQQQHHQQQQRYLANEAMLMTMKQPHFETPLKRPLGLPDTSSATKMPTPPQTTSTSEAEIMAASALVSLPESGVNAEPHHPFGMRQMQPVSRMPRTHDRAKFFSSMDSLGAGELPRLTLRNTHLLATTPINQPAAAVYYPVPRTVLQIEPREAFLDAYPPPVVPRHRSPSPSSDASDDGANNIHGNESSAGVWYSGCISLSLPEDEDVLSPLHCFMRKYCVEAFSARPDDVSTPRYGKAHGGKVVVGQVGIRCLHCQHIPPSRRPERAVCYPSSLKNIYHSIETWQRRHAAVCSEIPVWVRKTMTDLVRLSRTSAGGRRQYWEDAARKLGMVDTPFGVRFARVPGILESTVSSRSAADAVSLPLTKKEDKPLVTNYLFLLMDQMEICYFTEEDRSGGRSKVKDCPVGFPGMQCKHCRGKAGFGRYFPSSVDSLALANSDRNLYNHLRKCRRCPPEIQSELKRLRPENSKNKRGSRKLFFTKVWDRMHGGIFGGGGGGGGGEP